MNKNIKKFLITTFLCLGVFVVYITGLGIYHQRKTEKVVDSFYQQYNNRNFQAIYENLFNFQGKTNITPEQLEKLYLKLGNYKDKKMQSFKRLDSQGNLYYFRFHSSYDKGSSSDTFYIHKENNNLYKIQSFYNSYLNK